MDVKISKWQRQFLDRMDDPLGIAVCGIGSGKSYIMSVWLVLVNLRETRKTLALAQTYKALNRVLFQEILARLNELGVSYEYGKADMRISLPNGSVIYGYSAENAVSMLGLSGVDTLAVDEAAYMDETVYQYAKDRMRGSKNKSLTRLISSPNNFCHTSAWFSDLVKERPDCVIHASTLDNPFISDEFKAELRRRYPEGSNLWRQQVMGEIFDAEAADVLIHRRELHIGNPGNRQGLPVYAGYDASGVGTDTDVLTFVNPEGMLSQYVLDPKLDTIGKASFVRERMNACKAMAIEVDNTGGYGQGVLDLLIANGIKASGVNFAEHARNPAYPNKRTEMYSELAKELHSGFTVPEDNALMSQLTNVIVSINGRGQMQLAPKDLIKKTLGCSPDKADSLALAVDAMKAGCVSVHAPDAAEIANRYLNSLMMEMG